jgi:hypothetical protein
MPIWGTYFLLKLHREHFYLNDFIKHGEFALYTAAFLAPALQLVVRNIKDAKYVLGTGAVLFALAGLVVAVNIYSGVVVGVPYPQQLDETFLFRVSIVLFLSSLGFAVLVTLIENQLVNPNVEKSEAEDRRRLNEKFSERQPQAAAGITDAGATPDEPRLTSENDLASRFKPADDAPTSARENPNG